MRIREFYDLKERELERIGEFWWEFASFMIWKRENFRESVSSGENSRVLWFERERIGENYDFKEIENCQVMKWKE